MMDNVEVGQLTSSMVDDAFFIVKKCVRWGKYFGRKLFSPNVWTANHKQDRPQYYGLACWHLHPLPRFQSFK
jgi:hypothetical protein